MTLGKKIMRSTGFIVASFFTLVAGCSILEPRVAGEPRITQSVFDAEKTLTVINEMMLRSPYPPKDAIWFTPGLYTLEAEDADYWFLRSPHPLKLGSGSVLGMRFLPGGIVLSKRFNSAYFVGAAYIDDKVSGKIMIWQLTNEFRSMEGRYWTKSF